MPSLALGFSGSPPLQLVWMVAPQKLPGSFFFPRKYIRQLSYLSQAMQVSQIFCSSSWDWQSVQMVWGPQEIVSYRYSPSAQQAKNSLWTKTSSAVMMIHRHTCTMLQNRRGFSVAGFGWLLLGELSIAVAKNPLKGWFYRFVFSTVFCVTKILCKLLCNKNFWFLM